MMPLAGFLPFTDKRVRGTIGAIERELMRDGFVLRYRPEEEGVDGLPGREGVFLPCSFWLASCLHRIGRKKEARELFERLLGVRNDLGLLSEEYDPIGKRQLGNFPQAFSHVALVNTARILGEEKRPASHGGHDAKSNQARRFGKKKKKKRDIYLAAPLASAKR
jgi:GH15 family glucan-1,4-alpha-glucosidase